MSSPEHDDWTKVKEEIEQLNRLFSDDQRIKELRGFVRQMERAAVQTAHRALKRCVTVALLLLVDLWLLWAGVPPVLVALLAATGGLLLVFWALPTDGVGLLRGRPLYRAMIAAQIAGLGNLASVAAELLDAPGWLVLTLLGVSATAMWVCGLYALRWQRENQ